VRKNHPEAPIHPDLFQEMRTTVRWCITGLAGSTGLAGGTALVALRWWRAVRISVRRAGPHGTGVHWVGDA
jgi:hypothetical protein